MSLLLLPVLSPPVKRSSWWTAYKSTIEHALKRVQPSNDHEIARLDIAIVSTSSFPFTGSRTAFFAHFQDILREVYTLVCVGATNGKVELDFAGGVDARVFLLNNGSLDQMSEAMGKQYFSGPVIDQHTFVAAKRPYRTIYSAEGEHAEAALKALLHLWNESGSAPPVERLPCGPSIVQSEEKNVTDTDTRSHNVHKSVAVGGTFDHLHIGHKLLLAATVYMPDPDLSSSSTQKRTITIGITGDELLVNKKHGALVESWEERRQRTAELVDSLLVFHPEISASRTVQETDVPGPNGKNVKVTYGNEVDINYTRISDPFGPTITEEAISALVISAETRAGGKAVNDKRIEKGWEPLEVFEVDVLDAVVQEDHKGPATDGHTFESKISSTEIRRRLEAKARNTQGNL